MNFNQITIKIFKVNFRRYLLFFLCSSFTVLVFFTFMTIITNKEFMNPFKNSGSSNIIAPGLVVGIFSAFFTIYAESSFIKFRKNEFGTFMVLGMTTHNIRCIILLENGLIAIISLVVGLAAGTVFSRLFYFFLIKITDINGIPFSVSFMSYLYTITFFVLIYFLIITGSFIASSRYEIVKLMKSSRKEDENLLNGPIWIIVGIILMGLAFIDIEKNFDTEHSVVLLRSMILCYIGLYLIISNMVGLLSKAINLFYKRLDDNILFIADLKYGFGRSKKVLFLITLLTSITIFFCNLAAGLLNNSLNYALNHNPYDIAFKEIKGFNKISGSVLTDIVSKSDTPLLSLKTLDIAVANNFFTLLSDKNLNMELGTDINVEEGKFILLFQIVKDDGYYHDTTEIKSITVPSGTNGMELKLQGTLTRMLFNNTMGERYFVLNDNDFSNIKTNNTGKIILLSFEDWYKTGNVLKQLQNNLEAYNKEHFIDLKEDAILQISKPASRIGSYLDAKNGSSYLLFLIGFVSALFFISSAVILHFQLLIEYENEKIKYKKLYKIGITSSEIAKIVSKKLKILFFTPFIGSTLISAFYCYHTFPTKLEKIASIKYSIVIGLLYILFQFIFYFLYRITYIKRLIKALD